MKFDILVFVENLLRKIKFYENLTKKNRYFTGRPVKNF